MHRRAFVETAVSYSSLLSAASPFGLHRATPQSGWRKDFPALSQQVNGHPLVYLDTAATALRSTPVIEALVKFYREDNANPSATLHTLARRSYAALEGARAKVAAFIGANDPLEVAFTRGTTEGLNLIASTWGTANVKEGDEILIGVSEHASNALPWRVLARRTGARVVYFGTRDDGSPMLDEFAAKLTARTRIVAFSHVSNVLGLVNPAAQMCRMARAPGRIVVVDGAQSVPHIPTDVAALGCDFLAFSSHKLAGPMGVGVLWGKRDLLESMPPYQVGSNMAHDVDLLDEHFSDGAHKYSAGTANVSGPIALAAAVDYLSAIGFPALMAHEASITKRMLDRLTALPTVRVLGSQSPTGRISLVAFTVERRAPPELAAALDADGIAIRAGDLACLPLLKRFGVTVAARASAYVYSSLADIDRFADSLARAIRTS